MLFGQTKPTAFLFEIRKTKIRSIIIFLVINANFITDFIKKR